MALVIEDGSLVTGANSYVTVATAQEYADGLEIDVSISEGHVRQAMLYLEALRSDYQGAKVSDSQTTQFPRYGVYIDTYAIDSDVIPQCLIDAQCQLAIDAANGTSLLPTGDRREVISESYAKGIVAKTYSPGTGGSPKPRLTAADALIAPLLKSALNGGAWLTTRRV